MDDPTIEQQLRERLDLLDTSDAGTCLVPDLPLRDFVTVLVILFVVTAGLLWWAY